MPINYEKNNNTINAHCNSHNNEISNRPTL